MTGGCLTAYACRRPDGLGPARLGLVVGARCGGAVVRNRIKRRVRAAFFGACGASQGVDVVVYAAPGAVRAPFQDLVVALRRALELRREEGR